MDRFNVGDVVTWKSQAGGSRPKQKTGKVVAIVSAGIAARFCIPAGYQIKSGSIGLPRREVSYLVNPQGYGKEVLWPLAQKLRLAPPADGI